MTTYENLLIEMTKAALTGLLADPVDRADDLLPGERCEDGVARLAVTYARATVERLSIHIPDIKHHPYMGGDLP